MSILSGSGCTCVGGYNCCRLELWIQWSDKTACGYLHLSLGFVAPVETGIENKPAVYVK